MCECLCVCCKVAKTQRASLREIVELSRKRNSRPSSDRAKFSCCHFANICLVVWQRAKHFYNSNKKHQSSVQSSRVGLSPPSPATPPTYRTATAVPQLELLLLCPIFSVFISSPFACFPSLPLFPCSPAPCFPFPHCLC